MALVVYDRVQETTATTGTGSITLGGAVGGYQSFAVIGNGNTTYYCIVNGTQWEVGLGTYSTTGPTLARTTVYSNSNGNTSPITLSGSSNVFVTYPAEKSVNQDANGNVNITYAPNTTTSVGKLNVGDNTYSQSLTGQIAVFAGADTVSSNLYLINTNNTSNTAYSSIVTGANNYTTIYMEIGTNSSLYSYSAAGYQNNALNQPNNSFLQAYGSDLVLSTWTSNAIHFVQNASSATSDSMTLFATGGASFGGLGDPGIGNVAVNNAIVGFTAITSSSTAVSLVSSSTQVQAVVGSTAQRINLPQATTLLKGTFYTISNASSANVTIYDNAGTLLETITPGGAAQFLCTSNSTSAGTWGIRVFASSNTTWGTSTLNYTGSITGATWNGSTIGTGYGGTGLITFASGTNALYSTSTSVLASGTLPTAAGGTGVTTTPTNGQLLIGNGTNYTVASLGTGTGISTTTGSGTLTINNTGVTSAVAGTGISVSGATGAVTITNSLPMTYPGAGIPNSTGSAWGTSYSTTGSGSVVLSTSPTLTTPNLGTPSAIVLTNATSVPVNQATGTLAVANGGTGLTTTPVNGALDIGNGTGFTRTTLTAGTGISVTNSSGGITITNTSPSSGGTVTSVTGTSPVVSSGGTTPAISLASSYGDTQNPYASKTANYFLAAPNGSAGAPTFRAIVSADVPTLNQNTTGTAGGLTGTPNITVGTVNGTTITASTQFSGPGTGLTGTASSLSIGGNAATATSATSATTATNVSGGTVSATTGAFSSYLYAGTNASTTTGDITAARSSTTGVIFLGSSGTHYLYYDGSNYNMPSGQLYVNGTQAVLNSGTWSINVTGSANSATTATNLSGGSISGTTATLSGQLTVNNTVYFNTGTGASQFNDLNIGGVGGWSGTESHGINTYYGTVASPTIFSRFDTYWDGSNASFRWKNLYYGGPTTATVMTLTAASSTTANLNVTGSITGSSFSGAGTGLTGTASSLSIGGNAATATTAANGGVTSATAVAGTGISVTGVTTTGAATHTITNTGVTSIVAGTNVTISGSTGAVTINASAGTATAVQLPSTNPFVQNATTVSANLTITGYNAMAAGPITVNTGVTLTIATGYRCVIV